jgi:hypothetical protein
VSIFVDATSGTEVPFDLKDVVLAGYTGRDQDAVKKHVEELAAHGVPAPARVPTYYRVTPDRITTSDAISILGAETSGEAEFLLFRSGNALYVGVGSDHTDRAMERTTVTMSKQLCPKVVCPKVWRFDDIAAEWDRIVLRAFVGNGGAQRLYQEGPVTALMDPEEIVRGVVQRTGQAIEGVLIFSGTLPLLAELEFSSAFAVELSDPTRDLQLRVEYSVEVVSPLD